MPWGWLRVWTYRMSPERRFRVGDVVPAFQQVVGVDDQDGGLAVRGAADDVHVLLVAIRRDPADLGQGDGQGQGLRRPGWA